MSEIIDTQFADTDKKPNIKDIIIIKQLPVMEERFQEINAEITSRLSALDELEVSEDTKNTAKKILADFRKEFETFEERRKQVKAEINKPYDTMNALYEAYIGNPYKNAFNKLSAKVTDIEDKQKNVLLDEGVRFYNEYSKSVGLTFPEYDRNRFKIILTTTTKNLKEQIKKFLDGVKRDIESINTFGERADDIMMEYKCTLDLPSAIKTVNDRIQAKARYEAEKARAAEIAERQKQAEAKVDEAVNKTESSEPEIKPAQEITQPTIEKGKKLVYLWFELDREDFNELAKLAKGRNIKYGKYNANSSFGKSEHAGA